MWPTAPVGSHPFIGEPLEQSLTLAQAQGRVATTAILHHPEVSKAGSPRYPDLVGENLIKKGPPYLCLSGILMSSAVLATDCRCELCSRRRPPQRSNRGRSFHRVWPGLDNKIPFCDIRSWPHITESMASI
jgi:hypothetical protein